MESFGENGRRGPPLIKNFQGFPPDIVIRRGEPPVSKPKWDVRGVGGEQEKGGRAGLERPTQSWSWLEVEAAGVGDLEKDKRPSRQASEGNRPNPARAMTK